VLTEPERTAWDLRFRLLRFPVRVHPWFWIGAVLLGGSTLRDGLQFLAIWVVVVFVSILVHELGHAIAFRLFGADSDIVLYAFGGLAIPTMAISGRWRRVFIALAGPLAGFVLCGAVYGSNLGLNWGSRENGDEVAFLYYALFAVNLFWGIFNLLPVFPLDGGQVCREVCGMKWGTRGNKISLRISFVVAILVVAYSLFCAIDIKMFDRQLTSQFPWWIPPGSIWTAILFGFLAYSSYQLLQQITWTDTHWDDRVPWER
jgi:Zn-dependent protease